MKSEVNKLLLSRRRVNYAILNKLILNLGGVLILIYNHNKKPINFKSRFPSKTLNCTTDFSNLKTFLFS